MKIPVDGTIIYDRPLAILWFDKDGILCSVAKNVPRTLENTREQFEFIGSLLGGKKVCILSDVSFSGSIDQEAREFVKKHAALQYKAIAIVTTSALGTMIGTLLSIIFPFTVPAKVFINEAEARQWLKQYL
jgi:hypothetical protein